MKRLILRLLGLEIKVHEPKKSVEDIKIRSTMYPDCPWAFNDTFNPQNFENKLKSRLKQ